MSWFRLEPVTRDKSLTGAQGRLADPLWLLGRQWQLGEFDGEDGGSPTTVEVHGRAAQMTRFRPGPEGSTAQTASYDPNEIPIEVLAERNPDDPQGESLRFAAEAGLRFLAELAERRVSASAQASWLGAYPMPELTVPQRAGATQASLRWFDVMVLRAPDGRAIAAALRKAMGAPSTRMRALPPTPSVTTNRDRVIDAALAFLSWYEDATQTQINVDSAWLPERFESEFAVGVNVDDDDLVLRASEYVGGHLDWHSFDVSKESGLGAVKKQKLVDEKVFAAPVTFPGMPTRRFWQFEDGEVTFGLQSAGPADIARLLLVEFALTYGNDYYFLPVDLDLGSLCLLDGIVVTDTFGERALLSHSSKATGGGGPWAMFGLASGLEDAFLLAPSLPGSLHSAESEEEAILLRDEMANLAWAIEHRAPDPVGFAVDRHSAAREIDDAQVSATAAEPPTTTSPDPVSLKYRVGGTVPTNWFPLVPVHDGQIADRSVKYQLGNMTRSDGTLAPSPTAAFLNDLADKLVPEEEVPRTGVRLQRVWQRARWGNGATFVWLASRKGPSGGEGSSGLRFDTVTHNSEA